MSGGRNIVEECKGAHLLCLGKVLGAPISCLCSHVPWPLLTTREARECRLHSRWPCVSYKFNTMAEVENGY